MIESQLDQEQEPPLIGRFLTREEVNRYRQAVEGFLWPNESIEVRKLPDGFGEGEWEVSLPRSRWTGEYPLDEDASLIYYRTDSQLHVMMEPSRFLRLATGLSPESFKESAFFSRISYDNIMERIRKREPLDPLFLDVSWEKPSPALAHILKPRWEFVAHEGRHRAVASYDSGILTVPVIIFVRVWGELTPLWDMSDELVNRLRALFQ